MSDNEQKNENRETIADIVKELRRKYDSESKLATQLLKTDDDVDFALASCYAEDAKYISKIADRIEAAWARESKAIATENAVLPAVCITKPSGNAAAMRDALVKIREKCVIYNNDLAEEIDALCGNALSAPPRQCDVGTAEEQFARYLAFCKHESRGCQHCHANTTRLRGTSNCDLAWSQLPYEAEEGGAK